jgi:lysozyme
MVKLVDLSNNNPSPIHFGEIKRAGIFGVWMKVSEGVSFTDPDWKARSAAARKAGLHVGGYHFARPGRADARHEADYFCDRLGKVGRRDLRPVLDLEDDGHISSVSLHMWARTFLARVHERTGVRALTYSGPAFIMARQWAETFGTGAGLWLADYGPDDGADHGPHVPRPWRRCVAHQYTSRGRLPGVSGNVDLSHARSRRPILAHGLRGIV